MYGGLIDRVHDFLLCGVDPSMVDLSMCLARLKSASPRVYRDTDALLRVVFHHWIPAHHAFLYGPEFRACIASMCLVKVTSMNMHRLVWLRIICNRACWIARVLLFVLLPSIKTLNHACVHLDLSLSHRSLLKRSTHRYAAASPLWDVAHHHVICAG